MFGTVNLMTEGTARSSTWHPDRHNYTLLFQPKPLILNAKWAKFRYNAFYVLLRSYNKLYQLWSHSRKSRTVNRWLVYSFITGTRDSFPIYVNITLEQEQYLDTVSLYEGEVQKWSQRLLYFTNDDPKPLISSHNLRTYTSKLEENLHSLFLHR